MDSRDAARQLQKARSQFSQHLTPEDFEAFKSLAATFKEVLSVVKRKDYENTLRDLLDGDRRMLNEDPSLSDVQQRIFETQDKLNKLQREDTDYYNEHRRSRYDIDLDSLEERLNKFGKTVTIAEKPSIFRDKKPGLIPKSQ